MVMDSEDRVYHPEPGHAWGPFLVSHTVRGPWAAMVWDYEYRGSVNGVPFRQPVQHTFIMSMN